MTESTSQHDVTAIAVQWRQFLQARGADVNPIELIAEGRPAPTLAEARAAARRVLVPPTEGLGRTLSSLLKDWSSDWIETLQAHASWTTAGARLREALSLLSSGQIADAELEIVSLLAECCPAIQQGLPAALPSLRGVGATQPPLEQRSQSLAQLIHWLERLA